MSTQIFNSSKKEVIYSPSSQKSGKKIGKKHGNKHHVDDYSETMRMENPTLNPLSAFAPKPEKMGFDFQQIEEEVILLLRQHPITQIKPLLIAIGIALFPFIVAASPFLDFLPGRYIFAMLLAWYLMLIGYIFETFLLWFFNVYIITDERIIDVDFLSLIYKNISSAKIDNIQDVTAFTGGFLASMVNYGTIKIQTAGEKREFDFEAVPQPAKVTALLNELLLEEEREKIEGRVN